MCFWTNNYIKRQLAAFLLIGLGIYALISITKFITYHTEGYWKDEQLLNALDEMEYYFCNEKNNMNCKLEKPQNNQGEIV